MKLEDKYISSFFKLTEPCSFPGCDSLRKTYISELRGSNNKGTGCAACRRMSLVTKYKNIIRGRIGKSDG